MTKLYSIPCGQRSLRLWPTDRSAESRGDIFFLKNRTGIPAGIGRDCSGALCLPGIQTRAD
jgi:hypothetical protein